MKRARQWRRLNEPRSWVLHWARQECSDGAYGSTFGNGEYFRQYRNLRYSLNAPPLKICTRKYVVSSDGKSHSEYNWNFPHSKYNRNFLLGYNIRSPHIHKSGIQLDTNSFRGRFKGGDGRCNICNHHTEDLEHVIMECTDGQGKDTEVQKRSGLHEDSTSTIVERTKRTLERWERCTKDHVPKAPRFDNQ